MVGWLIVQAMSGKYIQIHEWKRDLYTVWNEQNNIR